MKKTLIKNPKKFNVIIGTVFLSGLFFYILAYHFTMQSLDIEVNIFINISYFMFLIAGIFTGYKLGISKIKNEQLLLNFNLSTWALIMITALHTIFASSIIQTFISIVFYIALFLQVIFFTNWVYRLTRKKQTKQIKTAALLCGLVFLFSLFIVYLTNINVLANLFTQKLFAILYIDSLILLLSIFFTIVLIKLILSPKKSK